MEALAFFAGYGHRSFGSKEQERASIKAARLMASLYESLEGSGYDDHESSIFLVRVLFALYADDSGMWERDMLLEFLETRTAEDGSDLGPQLAMLFQVMSKPVAQRQKNLDEIVARFPYVNGGIFLESLSIPSFDREMRDRLLECALFNWAEISPAIFGSLFQAVKSKSARHELGEHYTTETNILKVIQPLFLDELERRFTDSFHDARQLQRLRSDLGKLRFLDPACGCGNFLVVAYRELRGLELRISRRLQEVKAERDMNTGLGLLFDEEHLAVRMQHFHGIEVEEWPARIAATAMHLVDHQMNNAMELALGSGPETLPLDRIDTIYVGNALRTDWSSVVEPTQSLYVLGNPPFLGHATRTEEQAQELRDVWGRGDIGRLDYVTGWHAKALELFRRPEYAGEFGFVSTNSVTQGEPVPALFRPIFADGWRIKFSHRTFAWTCDAPAAASAYCTIVGFDKHPRRPAALYEYTDLRGAPEQLDVRTSINAYLVDGANVLVEQRRVPLSPELPPVRMRSMPRDGGHLIVERDELDAVRAGPVAARYLRRFMMGQELIHDTPRGCLWLEQLDPADVAQSPILRERLALVRDFRADSRAASTRSMALTPHLFGQRAQPEDAYVGIPKVFAERRLFAAVQWLQPSVIAGDKIYTCIDPGGAAFGVLSSSAFITWQKTIGGRLKNDPSFSNTIVWNTFPLPELTDTQRAAIVAGGAAVRDARALHPERSLADHYNPLAMDPALLEAHSALDRAVDAAFGLKGRVDTLDRQRALFAGYERLLNAEQLDVPKKTSRRRKATA